mgnify:CR=1 FL=1
MTRVPDPPATPASVPLSSVVAAGLVAGLVATVSAASFAALLFAGPLTPFVGQALGWYKPGEVAGWFASVVGAVVLLFVVSKVTNKSSS